MPPINPILACDHSTIFAQTGWVFQSLPKWKSVDIQRINPEVPDYRRISSYLGKQTDLELIALDPFNSDLSRKKK